jgi:hypothetical protein
MDEGASRPTPTGNSLRRAARLVATAASASDGHTLALVTLVTRLAGLAEAVAELRMLSGTQLRRPAPAGQPSTCMPQLATTWHLRTDPSRTGRRRPRSRHDWTSRRHCACSRPSQRRPARTDQPGQLPGYPVRRAARPDDHELAGGNHGPPRNEERPTSACLRQQAHVRKGEPQPSMAQHCSPALRARGHHPLHQASNDLSAQRTPWDRAYRATCHVGGTPQQGSLRIKRDGSRPG